jgi:hypothetical protein
MTTHRTIASTETDPQAPLVSALFKALANNLLAAFEGDATAIAAGVHLRPAALGQIAAGDVLIDQLQPSSPAMTVASFSSAGTGSGSAATSYYEALGVHRILNSGTLRIKGTLAASGYTSPGLRIYLNGSLVTTLGVGALSYDLAVAAGDELKFGLAGTWTTNSGGGSGSITLQHLRICGDAAKLWRY